MDVMKIGQDIDSWIAESELPSAANIRPIRKFDDLYPDDQDEYEAWCEWVHWHMNKDHAIIMTIQVNDKKDNWIPYEPDDSLSFPFSSMDFNRRFEGNNTLHWKIKKVYEKVKDLAQTYSCISDSDGKKRTEERFKLLVEKEFETELRTIIDHLKVYGHLMNKNKAAERIEELNKRIKKCKFIWLEHANSR